MTFAEIDLACKGYETRMAKLKEVPRIIATILLNVNRRAHTPAIQPEDVIGLYTDKEKQPVKLMSKDEYNQFKELRSKVVWQSRN